jgi:hypothetical protein
MFESMLMNVYGRNISIALFDTPTVNIEMPFGTPRTTGKRTYEYIPAFIHIYREYSPQLFAYNTNCWYF